MNDRRCLGIQTRTMGRLFLRATAALAALALACSADAPATATDAGTDAAKRKPDAGPRDAGPADVDPRLDRLTANDGSKVLAAMKLTIVYVGIDETEGSPSFDDYVAWLLGSGWWGIMKQYGVGPGTVVGSVRVPRAAMFQPGDVDGKGITGWSTLDWRLDGLLKATGDGGAPLVPKADAYLVFLPWGVNVDLGGETTCDTVGGFHSASFASKVPYAIMPPCGIGHSGTAISHELAEMATDPFPFSGWVDHSVKEGEIGDLCNSAALWDGRVVTRLWSNEAGGCVPE